MTKDAPPQSQNLPQNPPKNLLQDLVWQRLMGADETIGDVPVDRSVSAAGAAEDLLPREKTIAIKPVSRAGAQGPFMPAASQITAQNLDDLEAQLRAFEGLSIKKSAMNLVFGKGNPDARIMFIGEAPGADEDRQGQPFVGVSGQLLDKVKAEIGLTNDNSYTTNVIYWRPPGNRKPTPQEIATILPFITKHIELIDPALIVLLGDSACKALLGRPEGITKLRGQWFDYQSPGLSHPVPTLATLHPAFLLRSPIQKGNFWRDFLSVKQKMTALKLAS